MTLAITKSAFANKIINIVKEIYVLKTMYCLKFFILESICFSIQQNGVA